MTGLFSIKNYMIAKTNGKRYPIRRYDISAFLRSFLSTIEAKTE